MGHNDTSPNSFRDRNDFIFNNLSLLQLCPLEVLRVESGTFNLSYY